MSNETIEDIVAEMRNLEDEIHRSFDTELDFMIRSRLHDSAVLIGDFADRIMEAYNRAKLELGLVKAPCPICGKSVYMTGSVASDSSLMFKVECECGYSSCNCHTEQDAVEAHNRLASLARNGAQK